MNSNDPTQKKEEFNIDTFDENEIFTRLPWNDLLYILAGRMNFSVSFINDVIILICLDGLSSLVSRDLYGPISLTGELFLCYETWPSGVISFTASQYDEFFDYVRPLIEFYDRGYDLELEDYLQFYDPDECLVVYKKPTVDK